jgi:hypothetical protein
MHRGCCQQKSIKPTYKVKTPKIAQASPIAFTVEAGKTYHWCSCGESKAQPFCDGSHKGTDFTPQAYTAEKNGMVYFCACKHNASGVLCDGSHKRL